MLTLRNEKQKIYVLDSNVIMSDPGCLDAFDDNIVIIPATVIEEMDDHKNDSGDRGYNTRHVSKIIDGMRQKGNLLTGVPTENGGMIKIQSEYGDVRLPEAWKDKPDNQILKVAKYLSDTEKQPVILVTDDTNMRIKADIIGIKSEEYKHEQVDEDYLTYNGRDEVTVSDADFEKLINENAIPFSSILPENGDTKELLMNEFLIIRNRDTGKTKLGMVRENKIRLLCYENEKPYGVTPRNAGQRFCVEALLTPSDEIPLVILKGSAGTAKTFLTLACGLEQCVNRHDYRKITVTRANVEFDKDIGYLPGDEESKVGPLLRGCMDNLELLVTTQEKKTGAAYEASLQSKIDNLFNNGTISAEALGFLRGRSLTRQILFVDEAQNTTPSQMKGILTRVGEGTKLVISGDLNQIDNPHLDRRNNGLAYALKIMEGDPLCAVVGFYDRETTRSPLAADVAAKISG